MDERQPGAATPAGVPTDLDTLRRVARRAAEASGASRVVLFGSVARGQARPGSDLDLLLLFDEGGPGELRAAAVRAALAFWPRPFPMEFVPMPRADFEAGRSPLALEARREGIVLYG